MIKNKIKVYDILSYKYWLKQLHTINGEEHLTENRYLIFLFNVFSTNIQ